MEKIGKYITKYVKGKTPKELYEAPAEGLMPYLSPDYLRDKAAPEFYAFPTSKTVQVDEGEVIVLWDGSNAGEIFISKKGILASTMVKLDFDETEIDKPYYSYSFQYLEYFLKAKTAGSGIPHADKGVIKRLDFFKPEKTEQKAIATILSKVDAAIRATENSIKAAEKLKRGLMQNLFTGKLKVDGSWRKADEFYKDEKFGNVPLGWVVKKGNKITDKITKGQSPKWQGFEYQTEGVLFVTSENVLDGFIDVSSPKYLPIEFNDKIKNSQLQKGDILINIVGASIGRCAVYELDVEFANTNQAVCVFRPNSENDSDFIAYYIQLEQTQQRLLGNSVETARANLSLGDFRKFKFIIPETKDEQCLISAKVKEIDSIYISKHKKIKTLQRLRKSLMQNLLTGKVRVDVNKIEQVLQSQLN
ncbi:MAG: restriction endonuclease subunit S [Bacteroidota bacterium]